MNSNSVNLKPLTLSIAAGMLAMFATSSGLAVDYIVDTNLDSVAEDGQISLREAVMAADSDQAVGDAPAGEADGDRITFSPLLASNSVIVLVAGELSVTDDLTVDGNLPGGTITIDASSASRIMNISVDDIAGDLGDVSLSNLSLVNGASVDNGGAIFSRHDQALILDNVSISDSSAGASGGGVYHAGGTLTVGNAGFFGNSAAGDLADEGGGALYNNAGVVNINSSFFGNNAADGLAGSGGAINNSGGTVTVTGGSFDGNSASRAGGAIEHNSATSTTLTGVTITANRTGSNPGNGGGLHVTDSGSVQITSGMINGNQAAEEGGGLWNSDIGILSVSGTQIDGNTASGAAADQGGGGIFNAGGQLEITDATISNNQADGAAGSGGGVLNDGGALVVSGGTIESNSANRAGGGVEIVGTDDIATALESTLVGVSLSGNEALDLPGNGGGLHVTGAARTTITNGMVMGNSAGEEGGGLWNSSSGVMTVDGATIAMNNAAGDGADQGGGGIFNAGGELNLTNVILNENTATGAAGSGGGILNVSGQVTIIGGSISDNDAVRAGGGFEDSGDSSSEMTDVLISDNVAQGSPGNGGGVHITGAASMTITGGTVSGNKAASEGGGLWNSATGALIIDGTAISGNTASGIDADQGGGGVFNNGGRLNINAATISENGADSQLGAGGGILSATGNVAVVDSNITDNSANRVGGGIELLDATATLSGVTVSGNAAGSIALPPADTQGVIAVESGNGGGIHLTGQSRIQIDNSTISTNNAVASGGGFYVSDTGSVIVETSLISENIAESGAGVYNAGASISPADLNGPPSVLGGNVDIDTSTLSANEAAGDGGALNIVGGNVAIANSTLSGNVALGDGAGINITAGQVILSSTTLAANDASGDGGGVNNATVPDTNGGPGVTTGNSILATNVAGGSGPDFNGVFNSADYNLISDASDITLIGEIGNTQINIDPLIESLADNGGPTPTHALMELSPAIDIGDSDNCPGIDQRLFDRLDGLCDIGAYEANASMDLIFADDFEGMGDEI